MAPERSPSERAPIVERVEAFAMDWIPSGYRDDFRALMSELQSALSSGVSSSAEGEQWQPIETAPYNRKIIVSWVNALGNRRTTFACYWDAHTLPMADNVDDSFVDEEGMNSEGGWWEESEANDEEMFRLVEPLTHWREIPKPPSPPAVEEPR